MLLKTLQSRRAAPWTAFGLSGGLLIGAWIFQYGFGYLPCTMCYWQRHAHKAVLGIAALWLILRGLGVQAAEILRWAVVLALLVGCGIAAWHVGVEFGVLEGPKECAAGGLHVPEIDPDNPLGFLDNPVQPPACSEAVWHFLGLSMAAWNALLSLIGALLIGAGGIATSKAR